VRLDLGISSVVFESASAGDMTPDVVAWHCRTLGLRTVEVRADYLCGEGRSPGTVASVLGRHGLRVVYATDTVLAAEVSDVKDSGSRLRHDLAIAGALGARILRIFPGDLAHLGPAAAALAATWGRAAEEAGVQLVLENVAEGPGSDLPALADLVRRVPATVRLNVDVGNAAQAGLEVAAVVARVRDVIAMVHLKGLPDGDLRSIGAIDFAAVARALSGWDGPVCLEQDAGPAPWDTVMRWLHWLTSAGFSPERMGA